MIKFLIGLLCWVVIGAMFDSLGHTLRNWQCWVILSAVTVTEINERYWAKRGK